MSRLSASPDVLRSIRKQKGMLRKEIATSQTLIAAHARSLVSPVARISRREPVCGSWNGHLRRCAHRTASGAGSTLSVRAQEAKIDRQNHKRRPGGASGASWSLCFPGVEGNSGKPGSAIPLPKKLRRSDGSAGSGNGVVGFFQSVRKLFLALLYQNV